MLTHPLAPDPLPTFQSLFLTILPRIRLHGQVSFRHLRPDRRQEAIAEMVALCWEWFTRLALRGKDATGFPSVLASFAARAVRSGRRLCGQEPSRDALSPLAQQRHGFTVRSIPGGSSLFGNVFDEALADNTRTPPDEQAGAIR